MAPISVGDVRLFMFNEILSQPNKLRPNSLFCFTSYEEFLLLNGAETECDFEYSLNNYGHRCDNFKRQALQKNHFLFAGSIAILEVITKTVLYYFHERGWNFVKSGRQDNK
jgi:hypothetical protein